MLTGGLLSVLVEMREREANRKEGREGEERDRRREIEREDRYPVFNYMYFLFFYAQLTLFRRLNSTMTGSSWLRVTRVDVWSSFRGTAQKCG